MNSESLMNFGVVDLKNSVEFSMFINFAGEVMNFIEWIEVYGLKFKVLTQNFE